ncbi:hypothetical protein EMIT0P2_50113 [Pseudomonas sp. IT-P2]
MQSRCVASGQWIDSWCDPLFAVDCGAHRRGSWAGVTGPCKTFGRIYAPVRFDRCAAQWTSGQRPARSVRQAIGEAKTLNFSREHSLHTPPTIPRFPARQALWQLGYEFTLKLEEISNDVAKSIQLHRDGFNSASSLALASDCRPYRAVT